MTQFLIVPYEPPEGAATLTPSQQERLIRQYAAWTNGLARHGILRGGKRLDEQPGRVVSGTGPEMHIAVGRHPPGAAAIGGYWVVEADTYDAAVRLVEDCPHLEVGPLVIREVAAR